MGIYHLKNAELEPQFQQYYGSSRVPRRHCEDDSFVQYLLNKVHQFRKWLVHQAMDVIASLPGCEGQAADAISAGTPIKMDIAPRLLRNPKSECPDIWTQSWSNIEDPVVLFERNLYGHPLKGLF